MNRFNALFEYFLRQSGGQFEVTKTATALGITRPTVESHCALWEHLVLEHLQAHFANTSIRYWRDKAGCEVDFVLAQRRDEVDSVRGRLFHLAFQNMP